MLFFPLYSKKKKKKKKKKKIKKKLKKKEIFKILEETEKK